MKTTIKKVLCVLLAAVLLAAAACLSSCNKNGSATSTDASAGTAKSDNKKNKDEADAPVYPSEYGEHITLSADNTSPAPGDTVTVTLHMEGIANIASFDVLLTSSDNAYVQSFVEKDVGEFYTNLAEVDGGVNFGAYVAETYSVEALDMVTVSYTVADDAKPGDQLKFEAKFSLFDIGKTPEGEETERFEDQFTVAPLILTVQNRNQVQTETETQGR